jgi:hypothetical protein
MTLDLGTICISGFPIAGITAVGASSARQFGLGNGEFVAFARLYDEFALLPFPDGAKNCAAEMTVLQSVEEHSVKARTSLAHLRSAQADGVTLDLFVWQ